jgi:hypothetical protein
MRKSRFRGVELSPQQSSGFRPLPGVWQRSGRFWSPAGGHEEDRDAELPRWVARILASQDGLNAAPPWQRSCSGGPAAIGPLAARR